MSRISDIFKNRKAFIPFITAGDPNLAITEELVIAMAENGADLIELGIPFSDPIAEGPVIQEADIRALKSGTTTDNRDAWFVGFIEEDEHPLAIAVLVENGDSGGRVAAPVAAAVLRDALDRGY